MSLLDELHPASFKGVPFLIVTANKTAGRKVVVYDYPGKDIANSQDLGKLPSTFSLNGVITGTNKLDYFTAKKRLEDVLESEGAGILLHPFYGPINCVALPYTVVDDTSSLNEAQYTLTFRRIGKEIFPSKAIGFIGRVFHWWEKLYKSTTDLIHFLPVYKVNSAKNKQDGGLKLKKLVKKMKDVLKSVESEAKDAISKSLDNLDENAFIIASNPDQMVASIPDIMEQFGNVTDDSTLSYGLNSSLFGFGSDDTAIDPTTTDLQERANNREIINNSVNTLALSNMYVDASAIDYSNNEQIDVKVTELKNNYNFIINDNILSNDTLDNLYNLNAETRALLESIEVNISKVTLIFVKTTNLAALVYSYYGSLNRYDEILELNSDIVDPMIISGNIKILTD
jgi:hypothetical protein